MSDKWLQLFPELAGQQTTEPQLKNLFAKNANKVDQAFFDRVMEKKATFPSPQMPDTSYQSTTPPPSQQSQLGANPLGSASVASAAQPQGQGMPNAGAPAAPATTPATTPPNPAAPNPAKIRAEAAGAGGTALQNQLVPGSAAPTTPPVAGQTPASAANAAQTAPAPAVDPNAPAPNIEGQVQAGPKGWQDQMFNYEGSERNQVAHQAFTKELQTLNPKLFSPDGKLDFNNQADLKATYDQLPPEKQHQFASYAYHQAKQARAQLPAALEAAAKDPKAQAQVQSLAKDALLGSATALALPTGQDVSTLAKNTLAGNLTKEQIQQIQQDPELNQLAKQQGVGIFEAFQKMEPMQQLALGIGIPLALMGMISAVTGNTTGGIMMAALGGALGAYGYMGDKGMGKQMEGSPLKTPDWMAPKPGQMSAVTQEQGLEGVHPAIANQIRAQFRDPNSQAWKGIYEAAEKAGLGTPDQWGNSLALGPNSDTSIPFLGSAGDQVKKQIATQLETDPQLQGLSPEEKQSIIPYIYQQMKEKARVSRKSGQPAQPGA